MAIPPGGELLLLGNIGAAVAAGARVVVSGLTARYPVISAYLAFAIFRMTLLAYLARSGTRLFGLDGYGLVYSVGRPVVWALYFLVILELYSATLEEFPGIRRLGRLVLFSALAAMALACAGLTLLDQRAGVDPYPFLGYLVLQERSVFVALSAVTLLLLLFIGHYRIPVRRNVLILWTCFGGYFILSAVLRTLRWHFGAEFAPIRNVSNTVFDVLALLGATILLSRSGETEFRPMSPMWGGRNREVELALSLRLRNFNDALVKVLKQ